MANEFGRRVAAARKHAGFTQKQMAPLVGMSQSNLSELETVAFESGKTAQIAHVCGVDAYWLATGEGEMLATAVSQPRRLGAGSISPPTLDAALAKLAEAFAQPLPGDVRDDIADAMAKLVRRSGLPRDQEMVLRLLTLPPAVADALTGDEGPPLATQLQLADGPSSMPALPGGKRGATGRAKTRG